MHKRSVSRCSVGSDFARGMISERGAYATRLLWGWLGQMSRCTDCIALKNTKALVRGQWQFKYDMVALCESDIMCLWALLLADLGNPNP